MDSDLRMEPLNFDVNSNMESNQAPLYGLIDIGLKAGRLLFFGASYSVQPSEISQNDFTIKNRRHLQIFIKFLQVLFFLFQTIPFFCENLYLSQCCLVNYIKKGLHLVLLFCVLTSYYILEIKGRHPRKGLIRIYVQCVHLQKRFNAMGLQFPTLKKVRALGWGISILTCFICIGRQAVFASKNSIWYTRYARYFAEAISLGFWIPRENDTHILLPLGTMGVILDGILANYWFYCQVINLFFVLTVWIVFERLNKALKSGYFKAKNLADVIDLHFQSTKLLNLINQYMSLLTFSSTVYSIVCLCFWTNYIALDRKVKMHYIAALCFFLKAIFELVLEADVNSKAHQITEWLEDSCSQTDKFSNVDPIKVAIFTAQAYNKDTTGFRGLNFFVVTPRLAMAVAGIVMTYTVAVNQLCHS